MYGITFNGKHSYNDFGCYIESKTIQFPAKKKVKIDVPGINGSYDFSTVNSNGEITYGTREITIKFGFKAMNRQLLYVKYSKILAWLIDVGKSTLIFDDIKDYYFVAEVEASSSFEDFRRIGKMEIKFVADPFKTSIDYQGLFIWNTFNFYEDIVQDVDFNVVGTKTVSIYNAGRLITPTINVDATMSVIVGGVTYNLIVGDNKIYGLKLQNGYNSIDISGSGNIKFRFKKVKL